MSKPPGHSAHLRGKHQRSSDTTEDKPQLPAGPAEKRAFSLGSGWQRAFPLGSGSTSRQSRCAQGTAGEEAAGFAAVLHLPAGPALKAVARRLCGSRSSPGGSSGLRDAGSVAATEEEERAAGATLLLVRAQERREGVPELLGRGQRSGRLW